MCPETAAPPLISRRDDHGGAAAVGDGGVIVARSGRDRLGRTRADDTTNGRTGETGLLDTALDGKRGRVHPGVAKPYSESLARYEHLSCDTPVAGFRIGGGAHDTGTARLGSIPEACAKLGPTDGLYLLTGSSESYGTDGSAARGQHRRAASGDRTETPRRAECVAGTNGGGSSALNSAHSQRDRTATVSAVRSIETNERVTRGRHMRAASGEITAARRRGRCTVGDEGGERPDGGTSAQRVATVTAAPDERTQSSGVWLALLLAVAWVAPAGRRESGTGGERGGWLSIDSALRGVRTVGLAVAGLVRAPAPRLTPASTRAISVQSA